VSSKITYSEDGLLETLAAFKGLEADLRKEANAELRLAGRQAAVVLAAELAASASSSGVPVAPRVARSIRVKSDRLPTVVIGGPRKVGRRGAPAAVLAWGSEHGPRGDVNHFGVSPSSAGHWIRPAVLRFEAGEALTIYRRAIVDTMRRYKLL
jgi:hypothetical protein